MQDQDTLPGASMPRTALVCYAIAYVLRGGVTWGAIAFLAAVVTAAVITSQPVPHGTALLAAYYTAALAFLFGSLSNAQEILNVTNPARVVYAPAYRPRVWIWPFLLFGWLAVVLESPFILMLGVVAEGYLVSQIGTLPETGI